MIGNTNDPSILNLKRESPHSFRTVISHMRLTKASIPNTCMISHFILLSSQFVLLLLLMLSDVIQNPRVAQCLISQDPFHWVFHQTLLNQVFSQIAHLFPTFVFKVHLFSSDVLNAFLKIARMEGYCVRQHLVKSHACTPHVHCLVVTYRSFR